MSARDDAPGTRDVAGSADKIVASTADAAFMTDDQGLVVAWNRAAEELLDFPSDRVVGSPCHEALCGRDVFGNRYCDENCAVQRMAIRDEPARRFLLEVRHASGRGITVEVSVVRLVVDQHPMQLHMLFPVAPSPQGAAGPGSGAESTANAYERSKIEADEIHNLTPREREVLVHLAGGCTSQEVANELFISLATVRTHVQNILHKLHVHSQIEAVARAYRHGLI